MNVVENTYCLVYRSVIFMLAKTCIYI